jgi:hypothetical protein
MTTRLIAHVLGKLDGQPKHPKSAEAVYRALGRMEEAAQAIQEAVLVKEAHSLLVTKKSQRQAKIRALDLR